MEKVKVLVDDYDLRVIRRGDRYEGHILGIPFKAWGSSRRILDTLSWLLSCGEAEILSIDYFIDDVIIELETR